MNSLLTLWDVTSTAYKNKDAKFASMKVLMEKCEMTGLYFLILHNKNIQ